MSIHGIKHQSVENAFGMCEDLYGPESVRENDLTLLRLSKINTRFRDIQANDDEDKQHLMKQKIYTVFKYMYRNYLSYVKLLVRVVVDELVF